MNILQNRIDSFKNNTLKWPYANKQQYHKPETFAKAGFYFMRRPRTVDSVRCFMCDIDLGHWKAGQSPYTRHATESPACPWALLNFPDAAASSNRALTVNEKDPTTQPQHKVMRSARLATFNHHHYWPPNKSLKSRRFQVASKLSDAGFYFTPTLENTARIKCPYCKATIMEPDKTTDALALHRQLNDACPFFSQQRKLGTKSSSRNNRRDTTASTASSDTYKTAESQLDLALPPPPPPPQAQEVQQQGDNMVPQKRKPEQEEDDSIWDINHFLNIPAHVKKPTLTYGNKSTERRTRQRLLPSAGKRTHVDIFSNLDLSSSPSLAVERSLEGSSSSSQVKKPSLIEKMDKPRPKRTSTSTSTKKREPQQTKTVKEKAPTPSPTIPHAAATTEPPVTASIASSFSSRVLPPLQTQAQAQEPLPDDESLLMSPVFPPPDPILLDKPLAAIPIQFNKPTTASAEPPQSSESTLSSDENEDPVPLSTSTTPSRDKGKQRQVEHAIVPKKTTLSLSKSGRTSIPKRPPTSPTRSCNSDVAASLAKQMKYLQSTPMHSVSSRTVNAMDIFGECPLSPITTTTSSSSAAATAIPNSNAAHIRTPSMATTGTASSSADGVVGRTRSVFTADGQRRLFHSNNTTATNAPAMTLDVNSAPPVTAEQKQMSVEMYLQHVMDENIRKVREQGKQLIEIMKEKSEDIKQGLLSQKQQQQQQQQQ
ncbi:white collar 2 type of transcription factor [Mucor velutinosus]|uniref:White collar 2 type of transcription factor n=1 Tax=Mucor velutinosus TaxID=708070 RepID=A0AAN7DS17_9FUNG|nr:white collar 2 type of transcription factor [Mucor velutinosus]